VIDIIDELNAVHRQTGRGRIPAGEGRTVALRRSYDAAIEDVWDAITNPERVTRWFLPLTGDLRPGGQYQLKGNAGGEVLQCEPPRLLKVTWVFGDNPSEVDVNEVEVRLSSGEDGETVFELEHTAVVGPERWDEFGPGAVGVGWDLVLLGLSLYFSVGGALEDPEAWERSPEARRFITASSNAWGAANRAAGASAAEAATAVRNTTNFYAPEPS
jgi:uncharacterized protein YndB with AHSA1/START domain